MITIAFPDATTDELPSLRFTIGYILVSDPVAVPAAAIPANISGLDVPPFATTVKKMDCPAAR